MRRTVRWLLASSLLGLAACAPAFQPPTTGAAPAPEVAPRYRLAAPEAAPAVIVRWKAGHAAKRPPRGRLVRALRLDRAQLVAVADPAERAALLADLAADPAVEWAEPDGIMRACATTNDPLVGAQWAVPTIGLLAAWDHGRGWGVTIAVLDTGVDAAHPDLAGRVVNGPDLVQDDGNPMDDHGHGTHVAGTAAATAGNAVGVVGVAPGARILAVKVLNAEAWGTWSDIADGVVAASKGGAKVINMSLSGTSQSQALKAAIAQAQQAGALVVAAAGNDGVDVAPYPAAYPGVLAVGATTSADARAAFSNHGSWVAVAAPGENVISTSRGGYVYMSGTSMATPHVAGLAALLRARRPDWTATQVRDAIVQTGAPVVGFEANPAARRIDALAAMRRAAGVVASPAPAPTPTVAPTPTPAATATPTPAAGDTKAPAIWGLKATNVKATTATITWTTSEAADGQVEYGKTTALGTRTALQAPYTTWHSFGLAGLARGTTYYFRVRSRDRAGNLATSPTWSFRTAL